MEVFDGLHISECGLCYRIRCNVEIPIYGRHIWGRRIFINVFNIYIVCGSSIINDGVSVGKMGKTYTTKIYEKLTNKKRLNIIGWNGNLAVIILFGFYSVIGWVILFS